MRIANIIWFLVALIFLGIIAGFIWLFTIEYQDLISLALNQLERHDLREVLEEKYFTDHNFSRLQRLGYSVIPIAAGILGFWIVLRNKVIGGIDNLIQRIRGLIKAVIRSVRNSKTSTQYILAGLIILILIRSVYYALYYYPQYDECWNYNYFLSSNPLSSVLAYNNYPLHNLLTYLFLSLLPDSTFVMRLPNIILGLINVVLIFALVKRIFEKEELALAAAGLFAVLPTVVFYMLFARGVMLALFFAIPLLYFFIVPRAENWTKSDIVIVALISAWGSYSMISFPVLLCTLYLISLILILIRKNKVRIKHVLMAAVVSFVLSFLFYSPMLLGTGLNLQPHSGYLMNEVDWTLLIEKAEFVSRNQIGFYWGAYFFIILNMVLLFLSKRQYIILFNLALLATPFVLPILFKTYLPARALGFQAFAYLLSALVLLEYVLRFTNRYALVLIAILALLGFNYVSISHTFFTWSKSQDKGAFEIAQVFQEQKITDYYDLSGAFQYFVPSILYHHKIVGQPIRFYTNDKKSSRYLAAKDYKGEVFVIKTSDYKENGENKILYRYQDEDRGFTIYQKK